MAKTLDAKRNSAMERILSKAVCLVVSLGRPGNTTSISTGLIKTAAERRMLFAQKRLLESPELQEVARHDGRIRRYLYKEILPAKLGRGGVYPLPVGRVEVVEEELDRFFLEREGLVDTAVEFYPKRLEAAKEPLADLWNKSDYWTPEQFRAEFTSRRFYVAFDTPESLMAVSETLYRGKKREAEVMWKEVEGEIRDGFREAFAQLVNHMLDKLRGDEEAVRLKQPAVDKLIKFIDEFSQRDILNDSKLRQLQQTCRAALGGADAATLRSDESFRARVITKFEAVATSLDGMLENRPKRAISLED